MKTNEIMYSTWDCCGDVSTDSLYVSYYPSGEPIIITRVKAVKSILLRPKSINTFMAAMFWIDSLKERGNLPVELILPFAPGARQDRLNDTGDALFTAKSIANIINNSHIESVTLLDPHSDVFPALLKPRVNIVHIDKCFNTIDIQDVEGYTHIIAPDAGARKRAELIGKKLRLPVVQAWKTRDIATGAITGFGIEKFATEGRVLVVDDICDGGGTFLGLVNVLGGIKPDLFITHGIFSEGTETLLKNYRQIYCTDSIVGDKPGIKVNRMCEEYLD